MSCPIEDPLEIPETKLMMERSVILNHLAFNSSNPFTRSPMTRDELIEYNQLDEVRERVEAFKKRLSEYYTGK